MKDIDVFRLGVKVCSIPITASNATYTKRLMAEQNVVIDYSTTDIMPIKVLDYIIYNGVTYTLWSQPTPRISDGGVADYSLVFFAPYYTLYNKKLKHIGADGALADVFAYSGYTSDFARLIINRLNTVDSGWTIGEVEDLGFRSIEFNDNSCYTALQKTCETYKCEADFANKTLYIKKTIGVDTDLSFSYGKGKGLYELTAQELSNSSIVTRLEVYGGTANSLNGERLKLLSPLESNTVLYGVREDKVTFDHIFPSLKDKVVTGVSVPENIDIAAKWAINLGIDFSLSGLEIGGLTPQLQFLSGELMGVTFDLAAISDSNSNIDWNNQNKQCYINVKEDGEYRLPSVTRQPKVSDKFVLLNVAMDSSYIDEALVELQQEGEKYFASVNRPQLAYSLNIDPRYIKRNNTTINIGDKITVIDSKRELNDSVRVSIVKYPLYDPNNLDLVISSDVVYDSSEKINAKIENQSQATAIHSDDIYRQYLQLENLKREVIKVESHLNPVLARLYYDELTNALTSRSKFFSHDTIVMFSNGDDVGGGTGGNGTYYHDQLENRNLSSQHTIAAITDLQAMLDSKVHSNDARLSNARIANDVYAWAKNPVKPVYTASETGALKMISVNSVNGNNVDWNSVVFDMNALTISQIAVMNYTGQSNYPFYGYGQLLTFGSNGSLFSSQLAISNTGILSFRGSYNQNFLNTGWATVIHDAKDTQIIKGRYLTLQNTAASDVAFGANGSIFGMGCGVDTNGAYLSTQWNNGATFNFIQIGKEYASCNVKLLAPQFYTPNYGQGSVFMGTEKGLLPSYPNSYYPTIGTSFSHLYFSTGGKYTFGVGVMNNCTAFHLGDGIGAFWFQNSAIFDGYVQAAQLYCPSKGEGTLMIGTNVGLVGFPNSKAPTIKTTDYLYFSTDEKYHLAIGYNKGKTEFYNGYSPAFRFTAPIHCTSTIVMYSTT